jgi:DNA-binding CsgD family transcriptional regulator
MTEATPRGLYRRLTRLRWQVPLLALLLVLGHQLVEHTWLAHLPRWEHFATQMVFYGLVGPGLAWAALTWLQRAVLEREQAHQALQETRADLEESHRKLSFLLQVSRRLAGAEEEEDLIHGALELAMRVVPALGCSIIPFDHQGRPLTAVHHGALDPRHFDRWTEHLSHEGVRQACSCCTLHTAGQGHACPLLQAAPSALAVSRVYCLPLVRGQRQYGMLNLYLGQASRPTEQEKELLETLGREISLAMESLALRSREVMGYLARGATTAQIAQALGLAASTVKTHVEHILRKLEAANRAEAVAKAAARGWIRGRR